MNSLLLYPTHENCREILGDLQRRGLNAASFPHRCCEDDDPNNINCWSPDADRAERMGLPVMKAVCMRCNERDRCKRSGYIAQIVAAQRAEVALATHQRAATVGLRKLTGNREYVSVHESAVSILRPSCCVSEADLRSALQVVTMLLTDPRWLNWFGSDTRRDRNGNLIHDPKIRIRRQRLYEAAIVLHDLLESTVPQIESATRTQPWMPAHTTKIPQGLERLLYVASAGNRSKFEGTPWRILLAALGDRLYSAVIQVSAVRPGHPEPRKSLFGVFHNPPSDGQTVCFNDATLNTERLQRILGVPVTDATPDAWIPLRRSALQIPRDITRQTSPEVLAKILRAILAQNPELRRLGLITHRPLLSAVSCLEPELERRIKRTTYFGSGDERSSNAWHKDCDLIVVAGTPRVPPEAISQYLVQVGELEAACTVPQWGDVYWVGKTETGEERRIETRGYYDAAWMSAHRDLVRAAIVQSIGRGRGLLEDGCDVLVLSTEECGLELADSSLEPMNEKEWGVLACVQELTLKFPNRDLLGEVSVSTPEIAKRTDLSEPRARELLRSLETRGLVRRKGQRSGWFAVPSRQSELTNAC